MELLKNLYAIHSMSSQEGAMRKFIKNYVRENVPGASVRQDHGNIYIVKGVADTYPCVVAHLDQVQTKHSRDFRVFEYDNVLFAYSAENGRQEGLGADDKNGIWVALKCLERYDAIKVALFKEEEIGCGGSEIADMGFFADCRFAIQADRRNGGDLITDICGSICSAEFVDAIKPFAESHGYKETSGMMTDVETLSDKGIGISCINFSCGYYNPHTDAEYTKISELYNCLDFACDIIENCTEVYTHKREKMYFGYSHFGGYSGYGKIKYPYDWYGDDDEMDDLDEAGWRVVGGSAKDDTRIFIPDFKDYAEPIDAVYEFVWENGCNGYDPYSIWDYIESDCETYGITLDDYLAIVDYYTEDSFEEEDDLPAGKTERF